MKGAFFYKGSLKNTITIFSIEAIGAKPIRI